MIRKHFWQAGARHRAGDDGKKRPQLDDAVAPGEMRLGQELRQEAVFGRAEDGCLRAREENRRKKKWNGGLRVPMEAKQRGDGEEKDRDLEKFRTDSNGSLAEAVREISAGHRKEDERHGEERSEEHTSELQSRQYLVCRLLLEKKK